VHLLLLPPKQSESPFTKMLRTSFTKAARSTAILRTFTTSARTMAAGDTGAPPKTGGLGYVHVISTFSLSFRRAAAGPPFSKESKQLQLLSPTSPARTKNRDPS